MILLFESKFTSRKLSIIQMKFKRDWSFTGEKLFKGWFFKMKDITWKLFCETGNIESYLLYREILESEKE